MLLLRTAADLINAYFERRRAEEALDTERQQLLAVFESIEFPIYVADPRTYEILYANTTARGVSRPLVGLLCFRVLQNQPGPCAFCNNAALLAEPRRPLRWEFHNPVTGKDYIIYNRIIRWPDGRDVRFELDVDITELNRSRQLQIRTDRLESLSLLTGILGNISLVRELARGLTTQLLTFAKGAPVQPRENVDVVAAVREAATFSLRGSGVRFRLSHDTVACTVVADATQLSQAVQNLILNAAQAMPDEGFIDIDIRLSGLREGDHPLLKPGPYVLVSIADRGSGIPAELLDRVFDPFFTTKPAGTGLGLTTAHSIFHQAGGTLELAPRPGGGTEARFYLPSTLKPLQAAPPLGEALRPGHGRILVMDDEEMVRKVAVSMLRALGYEAHGAAEGGEAIDLYRRGIEEGRPFAAVILDLTVPGGIGGKETLSRLRQIDAAVIAVASSGYSADPLPGGSPDGRFAGYLPKPYTIAEVSRVLGSLLSG